MKIRVTNQKLKDVWDIQRAKKVLEILGLSSDGIMGLSNENKKILEEHITLYLWGQIKKQFPKMEIFCKGKTGGFNLKEERNYNTPIINIHGDFYIQLISQNNKNNWCWESVSLEPFRFEFNQEGYFKGLVVEAMNKAIMSGYASKETFKNLIEALNEEPTKESFITIQTKGKDCGKVDLKQVDTRII